MIEFPWKIAAVGFAVVALVGLRAWDVNHQQAKGAATVTAKVVKETTNVIKKGDAAIVRSAPGAPGRLLDPSTRAD
jgi:hypothetical protein